MPRLLLVDDNPSIHRIAESLLAPTDVELVCVDSAAEALDRIGRGERYDVALVDTAMPGMDGWTLLERLRSLPETAHMPIALMAGVLDPVDPAKLARAPVQGFLKKPIELRELGDRVMALLATPVAPPEPSPFSTVPSMPTRDLVPSREPALPEFRPDPAPVAPEPEEDLLILTAEDLWPEASVELPERSGAQEALRDEALVEAPSETLSEALAGEAGNPKVHLELEELDLESLRDLEVGQAAGAPAAPATGFEGLVAPDLGDALALPAEEPVASEAQEASLAHAAVEAMSLGDFDEFTVLPGDLDLPSPQPPPAVGAAAFPAVLAAPAFAPIPEPATLPEVPALEEPPVPAVAGQAAAAAGQGAPPEQAQALLQALLADPVLVDALVKAVVARMGDQVIREIAWEIMPDLAGKLQK